MPAGPTPLLSLPPWRIARELRAAAQAEWWAAEERLVWRRAIGAALRLWGAGAALVAWSVHTDSHAAGSVAFLGGLLLGNIAPYVVLVRRALADGG